MAETARGGGRIPSTAAGTDPGGDGSDRGRSRLFVAVPISGEALAGCRTLLDGVRAGSSGSGARWVRTEGLHLTLKFLGSTDRDQVPAVEAAVRAVAAGASCFAVELAGAGAFPSMGRPRVLWLGIAEGTPRLATLAHELDARLAPLGWPPETRPFKAHLTVARTDAVPIADGAAAARALVDAAAGWRRVFTADRVTLFRSHLGRGPARYEALVEALLGPTEPIG